MFRHVARLAADGTVLHVAVVRDSEADPVGLVARNHGVDVSECIACGDDRPAASPGWGHEAGTFAPPWRQISGADDPDAPDGAESGYPLDAAVWHGGKVWRSTVDNNVWEPGVSGWREEASDGDPEWVQPTGAHDAYATGDRVEWPDPDTGERRAWESLIDANTTEPGVDSLDRWWADLGPA